MSTPNPSSVTELGYLRRVVAAESALSVLLQLPTLVAEVRAARRLSLRDAADEIGIGFNTLYRVERGGQASLANVTAIVRWLSNGGQVR